MKRDVKNVLGTGVILFLVLFIFGNHCPIENIVGIPCPGCNMFSAIYWLLQKDFTAAWFFHPVVFLLVPYLAVLDLLFVRKREQLTKGIAFLRPDRHIAVCIDWRICMAYALYISTVSHAVE